MTLEPNPALGSFCRLPPRPRPQAMRGRRHRVLWVAPEADHPGNWAPGSPSDPEPKRALRAIQWCGAKSLLEAESLLNSGAWDALLLDIHDAGTCWPRYLSRLLALARGIPVLAVGPGHQRARALALGARDCLAQTGLTQDRLAQSIRHAIELSRRIERPAGGPRAPASDRPKPSATGALDALTGLPTRQALTRALSARLALGTLGWYACLIDLDGFRGINQRFGHSIGDLLLREAARVLTQALDLPGLLGRVDGDRFLALLQAPGPDQARQAAQRLKREIERVRWTQDGSRFELSASCALAPVVAGRASLETLLGLTEQVLAETRHQGPGRSVALGEGHRFRDTDPSALLDELISGQALTIVGQTIHALEDERVIGCEFLSRSRIPGLEEPEALFARSAQLGVRTAVDRAALGLSLEAAARLPAHQAAHVNLYPTTLLELTAGDALPRREPGAAAVLIELGEQELFGDPQNLVPAAAYLRRQGYRLGLDDVGFGQSCLENLLLLEPEVIKLDRRVVKGCGRSPGTGRALERLLGVARVLGSEVVAEGIENRGDLACLRNLGVASGQGFLWGRPG